MSVAASAPTTDAVFEQLAQLARAHTSLFADIWGRSRQAFGRAWVSELAENVVRLFGPEDTAAWEAALRGYAAFALDAVRSQERFAATGRYQATEFGEVRQQYYDSADHMLGRYLPGLFLSQYLWPHHFRLLRFFREEVVPRLIPPPTLFYDVGVGTGTYSREILRAFPATRGRGFDISPHAVTFAGRLLRAWGVSDRYEFVLGDVLEGEPAAPLADMVVSHELLEHIEWPDRLCRLLYALTRPGGRAYITAAVNAAHSDHIYLFRAPDEVEAMLTATGWRILAARAEPAEGDEEFDPRPCVCGFLCERA